MASAASHTRLRRLVYGPRAHAWLLLLTVLIGLLVRLEMVGDWNAQWPDSTARLRGDEPSYDSLALSILHGEGHNWPGRVPLYPLLLAGMHALAEHSYVGITYLQALLSLSAIPLTYLLGARLFGPVAGHLAALGAALSYALSQHALRLYSEVLYTPVLLAAAILLVEAARRPTHRRLILAGLAIGATNLVRPTLVFFPIALVLLFAVLHGRRGIRPGLVLSLAAVLIVTPWVVRNSVKYDAVFPLATSNAILWQGSPEYYRLLHDRGYTYMRVWGEVIYGPGWEAHDPTSVEGDKWWTRRALDSIRAEPDLYLRYAAEKLATYWVGDPHADWGGRPPFDTSVLRQTGFPADDLPRLVAERLFPVLALLAGLALWRRWRELAPLWALLLYCTVLHALTHAEARLSEPLQPVLLVIVAGAVVTASRRSRAGLPRRRERTHTTPGRTARTSPVV